jgi:uncharacterized protein YrrD
MYALASHMGGLPVISLQTGDTVGWAKKPIIEMASLELKAFRCETGTSKNQVLMVPDVRQFAPDCLIVNTEDDLTDPEDLVRLKTMLGSSFDPLRKLVVSDSGRRLGYVEDFTVNLETHRVQKLHVRQSIFQAWLGSTLTIDRTQIIDISHRQITVRDATAKSTMLPTKPIPDSPS